MATGGPELEALQFQAAADLREFQYRIVRHSAAGQINVASNAAAAFADGAVGVLQDKPNSNEFGAVGYMGRSKVKAGGAITAGRMITTQGSGKAAHAGSGDIAIGRALTAAGAEDEVFTALLFPPFRLSGAN